MPRSRTTSAVGTRRLLQPVTRRSSMKAWTTGNVAGTGTFRCTEGEYSVSLDAVDELPTCPNCGGTQFVRASLFTTSQNVIIDPDAEVEDDAWLAELRDGLHEPGQYVAYSSGEEVVAYTVAREWTRIGRSLAADIRFDDPTVSRRHALIVRQPDGLRVLDDRSLNGVFVNGERVEWSTLADGDEIVIGRHHLHFVDVPVVSGMRFSSTSDRDSKRHRTHGDGRQRVGLGVLQLLLHVDRHLRPAVLFPRKRGGAGGSGCGRLPHGLGLARSLRDEHRVRAGAGHSGFRHRHDRPGRDDTVPRPRGQRDRLADGRRQSPRTGPGTGLRGGRDDGSPTAPCRRHD